MAYTHFRFIAYEVPTAAHLLDQRTGGVYKDPLTGRNRVISGFDAGAECQTVARIPIHDPKNQLHVDARTDRKSVV